MIIKAPLKRMVARTPARVFAALGTLLLAANSVQACAVCYGDPNSDMAKGAVRGVAFMMVVTAVMLLSIASVAGLWIVRARRASQEPLESPEPLESSEPMESRRLDGELD